MSMAVATRPGAYAGSKHFVDGFVESLRIDLTGTGVIDTGSSQSKGVGDL